MSTILSTMETTLLSNLNSHPLDSEISFTIYPRRYTIKGLNRKPKSVTEIIEPFFKPFNSDVAIQGMMNSPKWQESPYYGKTPTEIKAEWKRANELGTLLHDTIEKYYNKISDDVISSDIIQEYGYFLQFVKDFMVLNPNWLPYRTEWFVFNRYLEISGAIDMVFVNEKGELWIVDWKRSRSIRFTNGYQNATGPLSHLDDCNFQKYCLQLNMYRTILERDYDKVIVAMDLVILHPINSNYVTRRVSRMEHEIEAILSIREQELTQIR